LRVFGKNCPKPREHAAMHLWKLVLAWCCLVLFFGIPIVFFSIHISQLNGNPTFASHASEFKYMADYLRTITTIIIALAGLNTVEIFKK
jgi:hypothetical protein